MPYNRLTWTLAYMWWYRWCLGFRNVLEYSSVTWCDTRCYFVIVLVMMSLYGLLKCEYSKHQGSTENDAKARFGKSIHISMISNSVTHLRSYTNSAIADNSAPISPVTPRDRRSPSAEPRCLRIERRYRRIEWPPRDRWRRCPKHRRLHIERRCLCIERWCRRIGWRVFHDGSQCFKSVSWWFTMF